VRIVWSPLALERVAEIAEGIAIDRPLAAEAWVEEILSAVERLADFPESGRVVPEVRREEIREVIQGDYRIIYRTDPDQVSILTVRHARQFTSAEDFP
jgi:toxin ParE1/3/4